MPLARIGQEQSEWTLPIGALPQQTFGVSGAAIQSEELFLEFLETLQNNLRPPGEPGITKRSRVFPFERFTSSPEVLVIPGSWISAGTVSTTSSLHRWGSSW